MRSFQEWLIIKEEDEFNKYADLKIIFKYVLGLYYDFYGKSYIANNKEYWENFLKAMEAKINLPLFINALLAAKRRGQSSGDYITLRDRLINTAKQVIKTMIDNYLLPNSQNISQLKPSPEEEAWEKSPITPFSKEDLMKLYPDSIGLKQPTEEDWYRTGSEELDVEDIRKLGPEYSSDEEEEMEISDKDILPFGKKSSLEKSLEMSRREQDIIKAYENNTDAQTIINMLVNNYRMSLGTAKAMVNKVIAKYRAMINRS